MAPGHPKIQKWTENYSSEGTPGTPQGTPKSSKSLKKSKNYNFPTPVWEGLWSISDVKNWAKIETENEIKSKLFVIKLLNRSKGKIIPTNKLFWKSIDGKNKNPHIKPSDIDKRANLNSIFL